MDMVNANSIKNIYAKCEVPLLPEMSLLGSLYMLLIAYSHD